MVSMICNHLFLFLFLFVYSCVCLFEILGPMLPWGGRPEYAMGGYILAVFSMSHLTPLAPSLGWITIVVIVTITKTITVTSTVEKRDVTDARSQMTF